MVNGIMRRALIASLVFLLAMVSYGFLSQERLVSLLVILVSVVFTLYILEQCCRLQDVANGAAELEEE